MLAGHLKIPLSLVLWVCFFIILKLLVELFVADIDNSNDIEERLSTCIMMRPRVTGGSEVRPILKQ